MSLRVVGSVLAGAAFVLLAVPVLYLARRLEHEAFRPRRDRKPPALDLQVTAISDETVTLRRVAKNPVNEPDIPGNYLLEGARGRGYAGRVIDSNEIIAIREYRHIDGVTRAGDFARLNGYAYPDDPRSAHGYDFETVTFASPLGEFPAWYVRGSNDTWAILTHGKGADRRECLRILPALVESGFHCLAITYRNDEDCLPGPRERYAYGHGEWEELDGAVSYALAHGAGDIVLVGFSMGGGITLSFMANSAQAAVVSGLILDAPMTHLEDTVVHGARQAGVPVRALAVSNRLSARLYRFRFTDFDYIKSLPGLEPPVLLFHGDADKTIPVELSDAVAAARPDIVTYVRVPRAGHVRSWNVNPDMYLSAVREFLRSRRSVRTGS
jgi:pimeloyl-ACP methyl ester carboxylesterase